MAFASWKVGERTGVTLQAWQLTREEDVWTGKNTEGMVLFFRSWKSHYRWQFCRFRQLPKQDLGMGFDETHERGKDDRDLISEGHLGVSESYGNEWCFIFWAPVCNWVQVSTNCRADHAIGDMDEETDSSGMIPAARKGLLGSWLLSLLLL